MSEILPLRSTSIWMHLYAGKDKKLPYSIGCVSLNFTRALQRIILFNFMNGSSLRELTKNIHETINSIQWVLKYIPRFKNIGGSLNSVGQNTCTIQTHAKITCWRSDQAKYVGKSLLGVTLVNLKINTIFKLIYKYTQKSRLHADILWIIVERLPSNP